MHGSFLIRSYYRRLQSAGAGRKIKFLLKGPLKTQVTKSNFILSERGIKCLLNLVPLRF